MNLHICTFMNIHATIYIENVLIPLPKSYYEYFLI